MLACVVIMVVVRLGKCVGKFFVPVLIALVNISRSTQTSGAHRACITTSQLLHITNTLVSKNCSANVCVCVFWLIQGLAQQAL